MGGFYVRSRSYVNHRTSQCCLTVFNTWNDFSIGAVTGAKSPLIYIVVVSYMGVFYISKPLNFEAIDQLV